MKTESVARPVRAGMGKRRFGRGIAAVAALGAMLAILPGPARAWPDKPIQIVVGFSAGGAADILARALAESLSRTLGQNVVVVNRDGAAGTIAMGLVAQGQPDGHTLGFGPAGPLVLQPHISASLPYKPGDVVGVCQAFVNNLVLAASPKSGYRSLQAVIDAARSNPGGVTYGTGGAGTVPHLAVVQLGMKAGVSLTVVPYRGDPPLAIDMKGGDMALGAMSAGVAQAQGLRMLAVFGPTRLADAPDVPTVTEAGVPVVAQLFGGLYAPRGVPAAVMKTLESACRQAVQTERYAASAKGTQQEAVFQDSAAFNRALATESDTLRGAIERANLKLN